MSTNNSAVSANNNFGVIDLKNGVFIKTILAAALVSVLMLALAGCSAVEGNSSINSMISSNASTLQSDISSATA